MGSKHGQDFPFTEYIGSRDIRNTFRLPRLGDPAMLDIYKSTDWPPHFPAHENYNSNFPTWGGYNKTPMTEEDFASASDASSTNSGSSNGSGRSKFTRGPRIHHIPILVEGRDDNSSGYSSDTPAEESKPPMHNKSRTHQSNGVHFQTNKEVEIPVTYGSPSNHNIPTNQQHQHPPGHVHPQPQNQFKGQTQRSYSDQQFGRAQGQSQDHHTRKSSSQPPSSPPADEKPPQPGPFMTRVRLNAPAPLVEGKSAVSAKSKKPKQKADPREQIRGILDEMEALKKDVMQFEGCTRDKRYRYLDEMLTRLMLKLDDVDTEGQDDIRGERRKAVKEIQSCIALLEEMITRNEEKARKRSEQHQGGDKEAGNDGTEQNGQSDDTNNRGQGPVSDPDADSLKGSGHGTQL